MTKLKKEPSPKQQASGSRTSRGGNNPPGAVQAPVGDDNSADESWRHFEIGLAYEESRTPENQLREAIERWLAYALESRVLENRSNSVKKLAATHGDPSSRVGEEELISVARVLQSICLVIDRQDWSALRVPDRWADEYLGTVDPKRDVEFFFHVPRGRARVLIATLMPIAHKGGTPKRIASRLLMALAHQGWRFDADRQTKLESAITTATQKAVEPLSAKKLVELSLVHAGVVKDLHAASQWTKAVDERLDWVAAEEQFKLGVSLAKIARGMGCSRQNVWRRANRDRWAERLASLDKTPTVESSSIKAATSPASGLDRMEPMEIVDEWLSLFKSALATGRVRHDAIADLAAALKLKQSLTEAHSHTERRSDLPTLDQLQERHRRYRAQKAQVLAFPELAGLESNRAE